MLAPAAGKITSELIRLGRAETLDVRPYRASRFAENDPIVDPQIWRRGSRRARSPSQ